MIRVAPDGTLTFRTTAEVLARPELVEQLVELRYSAADPFAVVLRFVASWDEADEADEADDETAERGEGRYPTGGVLWHLDRQSLDNGHAPGEPYGDVRVTRLNGLGMVVIQLSPGSGAAAFVRFTTSDVDQFLGATYRLVPHGAESIEMDGLIRQLLSYP